MGGDAILHHPGNSTRFDYISRVFKASCQSKSRRLYLNIIQLTPETNAEEVFQNETVLALSRYRRGRRLDPVSALYQAEDIFNYCRARLPPDNAAFRLVWFLGEDQGYYNQVYIRFEHPASDAIRNYTTWDRSLLLEDLQTSEGRFIETEPTIVKLWTQ